MLEKMRQNANSWFIKFLLVLVMASFVMWGVLDMVMRSQSNQTVATVGGHSLSADTLLHNVDRMMRMLQQHRINNMDPSIVVERSLDELINSNLIDQEIEQHGLMISDTWLREIVQSMPVFQHNGRFDPERFRNLLAQNHLTDSRFLADLREQLKTQNYTSAILSGVTLPKLYAQHVMKAIQTPYVFATVTLTTKEMAEPTPPKEDELQLYYSNNTQRYVIPERRLVNVLHVNTQKIAENTPVSQEDVKSLFEERHPTTDQAEQRNIQHVTFPTRAAADKALKQLTKNKNLKDLAKDWSNTKLKEETLTKEQAPQALADILFTLKKGTNTGIIETPNGYSIYQVVGIQGSNTTSLDTQTYKQLESEIRINRSGDAIKQWLDQLNDSLASGQSLNDLAKKHNLKISTFEIQESGQTVDGKWPENLKPETSQKIGKEAFTQSTGQTSQLVEIDPTTSMVVSVEKITPARTPDFKEVQSDVKRDWTHTAKQKMVEEKCRELSKAENTTGLIKAAAAMGFKVVTQKPVSSLQLQEAINAKDEAKADIPSTLLDVDGYALSQIFSLQPGENIVGRLHKGDGMVVIMLDHCLKPNTTDDKKLEAGVKGAFEKDLINLLLAALKKKNPVQIDTEVVKTITERLQTK